MKTYSFFVCIYLETDDVEVEEFHFHYNERYQPRYTSFTFDLESYSYANTDFISIITTESIMMLSPFDIPRTTWSK